MNDPERVQEAIQRAEKAERDLEMTLPQLQRAEEERDEARADWRKATDDRTALMRQLDQARALLRECFSQAGLNKNPELLAKLQTFLSTPNPTEGTE